MILKSINLLNIRSYISQRVDFPEGSVMLSGDIGSGKSTILLAAEFALFGIMKGDVSGESLLRNGKKEGSVEMHLEINGKDVIINRALKKSSTGVKQDAGYIIIDGVKKAATSTELKSIILDLLGYPKDLLTKSKGLIYRYTVYTPQEDMKRILFDDQEARLNTLRKVFDVDKYRRIRENAKIYMTEARGKTREIEGFILDLDEKKKQLQERMHEVSDVGIKIEEIKPRLGIAKEDAEKCGKDVKACGKEIESLVKLKNELSLLDNDLKNKVMQRQRNNSDIEALEKSASVLEKEVEGKDVEEAGPAIKEKEESVSFLEETKLRISKKIAELNSKRGICAETKEKVAKIDSCPLCLQDVSHEHKKSITERENTSIAELAKEIKIHEIQEKEAAEKIRLLKKELDELRKKQAAAEAVKVKVSELDERRKRIELLKKEQEGIKKGIGEINLKKLDVSGKIRLLKDAEAKHAELQKAYDDSFRKFHEIEIELNTFETDRKGKLAIAKSLEEDVAKKEEAKSRLQSVRDIQHWLETDFTSLMALMEKQVMAKVYHSFNELFQSWFNALMEEESITARLDDAFTPMVQQNGYDINIVHLSGGEKTSCALAYRLSLNKVINDLISTVNTKDIIILDEPTDGFSTEQLDRVREVIDQLNMNQIIIVSHEQKIEGFVDNVIRIHKNEHISSVVASIS